jgi:hypothetical protein
MLTILKSLLVVAVALGLIGCSSISVSSDYDPSVDFSQYKTYKWGTMDNPNDALQKNQLVLKRVYDAIDRSLQAKGFSKVEDDPDFLAYPHAGTQEKTDVQSWGGYGYGGWWGAGPYRGGYGGGGIDVTQYTEATVFVDMVDNKSQQLFWRGTGTGVINPPSSPEESTEKVNDAISQILADFPPKAI